MKKITLSLIGLTVSLLSVAQTVTFKYTDSIKLYAIPPCVDSITITAKGAQGGYSNYGSGKAGGLGADITGTFAVTYGQVLEVLAGGMGVFDSLKTGGDYLNGGGGGGSFVWIKSDSSLLIAAGGGGGANSCANTVGGPGLNTLGGTGLGGTSFCGTSCDNGNGVGGGGAGWKSNGAPSGKTPCNVCTPAMTPLLGGTGGIPCTAISPFLGANGGFGGGGAGDGNCGGGGGGGGYSGGNGGGNTLIGTCTTNASTGGTSYNIGVNQTNISGKDSGNGEVIIVLHATTATPPNITNITPTPVNCCGDNNGSAAATVTGGTAPYTYSWSTIPVQTSPTATGLTAGTYTLNVTDKTGCTVTGSVTITQPACLADSAYSTGGPACPGQCVSVNVFSVGGTPAYTYTWNTGATSTSVTVCPVTSTTYTVTSVDKNGCTTTTSVFVMVKTPPTVTLKASKDSACSTATKDSLTGSPKGGAYSGTGVTGANFDPTTAGVGSHTVTYKYTDTTTGCSDSAMVTIIVSNCTGINEINALDNEIKFYPDPFTMALNMNVNLSGQVTMDMFNSIGEHLGTWTLKKGANTINTSNLPAGVYFIKVKTEYGELNKKLVKVQ